MSQDDDEKVREKKVLSVRMDEIEYILLKKICDRKDVSLSYYANKIIKRYINKNSEKIKEKLNIDIEGIRRQLIAELKDVKFLRDLNNFEKEAIDNMYEIFKTVSEITEEKLKQLLNLSQESLDKIIFANSEELRRRNLYLDYKLGKIFKLSVEKKDRERA